MDRMRRFLLSLPIMERTADSSTRFALPVVVLCAIVAASLFPFRLDPPRFRRNEVVRGPAGEVELGRHNVLRSRGAPAWLRAVRAGGRLAIALEARPAAAEQTGPARILALSHSAYRADLVIGQEVVDLVVRVKRPGSEPWGSPAFVARGALAGRDWIAISVVLEPDRLRVVVDGEVRVDEPLARGYARSWSATCRLALGDEPGGARPWRGTLRCASVDAGGQVHDLLAPGVLEQPAGSWVLPERLSQPRRFGGEGLAVAALHFAAFSVLGWLMARASKTSRPRLRAVAACALLGLGLAGAKVFVAARHPSAVDLVVQIVGAAVGARADGRSPMVRARDRSAARA